MFRVAFDKMMHAKYSTFRGTKNDLSPSIVDEEIKLFSSWIYKYSTNYSYLPSTRTPDKYLFHAFESYFSNNAAKEFFGFSPNANILLVLGGSQGAAALNEWVNNHFDRLAAENMDVLCVCGPGKDKFEDRKTTGGDGSEREIKFLEFCDNMAAAMSAAELCVARAGAGTIAELARCRVPSIIVPYPFAADNHQLENANCFEKQGACVVLPQNDLHKLFAEVLRLTGNEKLKATMRKNLERVDDLNDTSKIVCDLTNVARGEFE